MFAAVPSSEAVDWDRSPPQLQGKMAVRMEPLSRLAFTSLKKQDDRAQLQVFQIVNIYMTAVLVHCSVVIRTV